MPDEWTTFFMPYFSSPESVHEFVQRCEQLDGPHPAKLMMHQTQRLVSLADEAPQLPSGGESLKVLFLIVCAENIAKLHDDFADEGHSKKFVRQFFDQFVRDDDKELLRSRCVGIHFETLQLRDVVDGLYRVRCDVVHEGRYWGFSFSTDGSHTASGDSPFWTQMSADEFRDIVVRACIRAIDNKVAR